METTTNPQHVTESNRENDFISTDSKPSATTKPLRKKKRVIQTITHGLKRAPRWILSTPRFLFMKRRNLIKPSSLLSRNEEERVRSSLNGSHAATTNNNSFYINDSNYNRNMRNSVHSIEHEQQQDVLGQGRDTTMYTIEAQVMNDVERALRAILILSTVYLLGVYHPGGSYILESIVKVVFIAWVTILFVQFLTFMSSLHLPNSTSTATTISDIDRQPVDLSEREPLLESNMEKYNGLDDDEDYVSSEERDYNASLADLNGTVPRRMTRWNTKVLRGSSEKKSVEDTSYAYSSRDMDQDVDLGILSMNSDVEGMSMDPTLVCSNTCVLSPQNHPELEDVFVINDYNDERATCNDDVIVLETEYIKGRAWFSIRTSDADKKIAPSNSEGTPQNDVVSNYFRKKQRRFELQMQFKFKKVPDSNLFIGFFIEEPIQLGMVQRAFVNAALGFLQKKLKGSLHCNTTGDSPSDDDQKSGAYEQPHFSLSLLQTLDRFVVSPDGVVPPQLGTEIHEDSESMKRRKSSGFSIEFNSKDTYTMCIWSAYVDFVKWKIVNLPMVRPFSIASVIGDQPLSVIIYSIGKNGNKMDKEHSRVNMNQILNYQVSNAKSCAIGGARQRFLEKCTIKPKQNNGEVDRTELSEEEVSLDDEYSSDEPDDATVAVVEDLGEGIYVHSGDSIVLRESSNQHGRYSALTNSGGYAALASFSSTAIVLEKVVKNPRDSQHHESSLIRNGDTVLIKSLSDDSALQSYLSVYKGSWLRWITRIPRSSGLFIVKTFAPESKHGLQVDAQSLYLRLGGEFSLISKSFGLKVGIQLFDSAAFGGRVLGLRPKSDSDSTGINELAPLLLCADELASPPFYFKSDSPHKPPSPHQRASREVDLIQYDVDVPAWIEMLHRSKRALQRVYVIRATGYNSNSFIKLRTGKELSPLIRLGLSLEKNQDMSNRDITQTISTEDPMFTIDHSTSCISQSDYFDEESMHSDCSSSDVEEEDEDEDGENFFTQQKGSKSHGWIRNTTSGFSKVARGVKSGTINVGKALKPRRHRRRNLPRTPGQGKRSIYKDHHVAVNRMLKSSRHLSSNSVSNALAGQLNAGCETCRTVNNVISGLKASVDSMDNSNILSDVLSLETELDSSFLTGGLVELGVEPKDINSTTIAGEFVVAKASWQSFWKEQGLVIDSKTLNFYNPLSATSCLTVAFLDIRNVRHIDEQTLPSCPIVSFPLLAVETSSTIHYIAFLNRERRQKCYDIVVSFLAPALRSVSEKDEANSFWQGFQALSENKWTKIYSKKKKKTRVVLNARRTAFDCPSFESVEQCESHVQDMLSRLLSFESLEFVQPYQFLEFLDLASGLKNLPLKRLNKSNASTFCICTNVYHVLLLHALLLFGVPSKKHLVTFMRTYCYEIGGDVFSLAELDSCVIAGNYARPYKSPFPVAPRRSIATYPKLYALEYVDARLHFVICRNLRDASKIPILYSDTLDEVLSELSRKYVSKHFMVDTDKRVITLPKICSVYRNDFGSDQRSCALWLIKYMEPEMQIQISDLLENSAYTLMRYESSMD